jgi:hypothetical protein
VKKRIAAGSQRFPQPLFIGCILLLFVGFLGSTQTIESTLGRSTYSESQKSEIKAFFSRAEQTGIPLELLLPKLQEGIAKRVPAHRVLTVLETEAESLAEARTLLLRIEGGQMVLSDRASWARTANLLAGGIPRGEIEALIELCVSRAGTYRPATYLYVALTEWGLGRKPALDLSASLIDSSISPDRYMGVMDLLTTGRRMRIAPEELVQRIQEHLDHVTRVEELEKWIY